MTEEKFKAAQLEVKKEIEKINILSNMVIENTEVMCNSAWFYGFTGAGMMYPKNHNQSKTSVINQIVMLRNELLVLAKKINGES